MRAFEFVGAEAAGGVAEVAIPTPATIAMEEEHETDSGTPGFAGIIGRFLRKSTDWAESRADLTID